MERSASPPGSSSTSTTPSSASTSNSSPRGPIGVRSQQKQTPATQLTSQSTATNTKSSGPLTQTQRKVPQQQQQPLSQSTSQGHKEQEEGEKIQKQHRASYRFLYYASRGRLEMSLLLLEDLGDNCPEYEVDRWGFGEEGKTRMRQLKEAGRLPFGQVPVLEEIEVDETGKSTVVLRLAQSQAIIRYLARRHGYYPSSHAGRDAVESARLAGRCDMLADCCEDVRLAYARAVSGKEEDRQNYVANKAVSQLAQLPEQLRMLSAARAQNAGEVGGEESWLVGDEITYADFVLFDVLDGLLDAWPNCLRDEPLLHRLHRRVGQRPNIARYLTSDRRMKPSSAIFANLLSTSGGGSGSGIGSSSLGIKRDQATPNSSSSSAPNDAGRGDDDLAAMREFLRNELGILSAKQLASITRPPSHGECPSCSCPLVHPARMTPCGHRVCPQCADALNDYYSQNPHARSDRDRKLGSVGDAGEGLRGSEKGKGVERKDGGDDARIEDYSALAGEFMFVCPTCGVDVTDITFES